MVYWKGEQFWLGKLLEHPEIMTQGGTLEALEENLKDAYRMMVWEDSTRRLRDERDRFVKRRELIRQLEWACCILVRHGARHEIYHNPANNPYRATMMLMTI